MSGAAPSGSPERGRQSDLQCLRFLLPRVVLVVSYLLYLALGGLVFSHVESPLYSQLSAEERAKAAEAQNTKEVILEAYRNASMGIGKVEDSNINITALLDSLIDTVDHPDWKAGRRKSLLQGRTWSFPSAMLFSMTTITTIGYGDIVPETVTGQVFCVVYSIVGVPLSFYLLADIGQVLAVAFIYLVRWCRSKCCRRASITRRWRKASEAGPSAAQAPDVATPRMKQQKRHLGTMPNVTMRHMQSVRFHVGGGGGDERPKTERVETVNCVRGDGGGDMAIEFNELNDHRNGRTALNTNTSTPANRYKTTVTTVTTTLDEKKVDEMKTDEKKEPLEMSDTVIDNVTDEDNSKEDDYGNNYHADEVSIILVMVTLACYFCISAYAFSFVEGWDYGKAIYFTFITLTTIGFGDVVPEEQYSSGRFLLCLLFTLMGLAVTSMCIALVQDRACRAGKKLVGYLDRRVKSREEEVEEEVEAGNPDMERDPEKLNSSVG